MSISKSYNKQNDTTYVYEVIENYWDKEKKQPRSKRKLIGKIDPVTGEIVPTKSRAKSQISDDVDYKKLCRSLKKEIEQKDIRISELESMVKKYLSEERNFLQETEISIKNRITKTDSLLHQ